MKVCILSMQKVPNMGSLLQGYSLKKILESLGHDVHFIDIERKESDDLILVQEGKKNVFSAEAESRGRLSKLKKLDRYTINRIRIKRQAQKQDAEFEKFRRQVLGIKDSDNDQYYDICVIGSDEVFNCLTNDQWGFTSQLFGIVRQAKKVITYAASCGSTRIIDVPTKVQDIIRNSFKRISAFSVRDENTKVFAETLTDKKIQLHFDPVMVGNFETEISNCKELELPDNYCIIYSYYNRIHTKDEIQKIIKFCNNKGLTPVAIGAPQMWIKNYPVLSPFETLLAFKNAEYVITDTFHGTIFAAKYAKAFAAMVRKSNMNKLDDLLNRLNLNSHRITDFSQLILDSERFKNNPKLIEDIITKELAATISYLRENC